MKIKDIEPAQSSTDERLTPEIRSFWTRNVNCERLMGHSVTAHERGDSQYFSDLESQRYRSHRHLLPWIEAIRPPARVLEIGCGIGLDSFVMARRGLDITAVDLTDVGVSTARQRFADSGVPGSFAVCNAAFLPLPGGSFDYVYSFGVLHHTADTAACVRETHRVLRPGGQARIMLYHRRSINELVHRLLRVPFEERDELCPMVRRFTLSEVREMFSMFSSVHAELAYAFGEGYGALFRVTPQRLHNWLSRHWGWHIMIVATK